VGCVVGLSICLQLKVEEIAAAGYVYLGGAVRDVRVPMGGNNLSLLRVA
jgi:hypothetical protein